MSRWASAAEFLGYLQAAEQRDLDQVQEETEAMAAAKRGATTAVGRGCIRIPRVARLQ